MTALLSRTPAALAEFLPDCAEAHLWFEKIHAQNRINAFDAHDYLHQSWAYEAHDVGTTAGFEGDTEAALASIKAKTLVLAPPLDLFNPAEAARAAAARIPGAQFIEIPSVQGHQAATSTKPEDAAFLNRVIGEFLARDEGRGTREGKDRYWVLRVRSCEKNLATGMAAIRLCQSPSPVTSHCSEATP